MEKGSAAAKAVDWVKKKRVKFNAMTEVFELSEDDDDPRYEEVHNHSLRSDDKEDGEVSEEEDSNASDSSELSEMDEESLRRMLSETDGQDVISEDLSR